MIERTAAESKLGCVIAMGDELGAVYSELWQELGRVHGKWSEYVVLFGTKESRVNLLNEAAPRFTRMVQDVLWDDVVLHMARLTDPPKSAGRACLTLRQLPGLVGDAPTRAGVEAALAAASTATEFCRDWRNRRLAHTDYDLALETTNAVPLAPASRLLVKEALKALTAVLDAVSMRYLDGTTNRLDLDVVDGGAMALLHVLDSGLKADRAKDERFKAGKFDADDFGLRDI